MNEDQDLPELRAELRAHIANLSSRVDAFEAARDVLMLIAQPKKGMRLLNELQMRMDAVQKAEAADAARHEAHEQKLASDLADLREREQRIRRREIDVAEREGRVDASWKAIEQTKAELARRYHDPNIMVGSTLTREPA
jgi:hypothetical protein